MATIQVRELPEDSYEVLRRRARLAGQSIQAYMRDQLIALAAVPTKDEAVQLIERALRTHDGPPLSAEDVVADLHAERR